MKIDIDKFCRYLTGNAQPRSTGYCARYVRIALEAAGWRSSRPLASAYMYEDELRKSCDDLTATPIMPHKGDIIVWRNGGKHKHGHIQAWDGKHWISDFVQNSMFPNILRKDEWLQNGYVYFRFRQELITTTTNY